MGNLIISLHVSIDGFVAGPNGEMDWIGIDQNMFDYVGKITDTAATAFYGRKTFEMMDGYWPDAGKKPNASKHDIEHSEWYNNADKLVLSNSMIGKNKDKVHFIGADSLSDAIATAKEKGNIAVFGSPSAIHELFAKNLVDEMYLFVNPVLLGQGIPLFKGISERMKWKQDEVKQFESCKVTGLHYSRA